MRDVLYITGSQFQSYVTAADEAETTLRRRALMLVELGVPLETLPEVVDASRFTGRTKTAWSRLMRDLREGSQHE
jgi:hypothetical protein